MRFLKLITILFLSLLLSQIIIQPVFARQITTTPKQRIAFIDPSSETITLFADEIMTNGYPLYIVNQSAETVEIQVYTPGLEKILTPEISNTSIDAGKVLKINFSLPENGLIGKDPYYGFLVFTTSQGDVIYKNITLDPDPRPNNPVPVKADEIQLTGVPENINWDELANKELKGSIINGSKNKVNLIVSLVFPGNDVFICNVEDVEAYSLGDIHCDLNNKPFLSKEGKYVGFLTAHYQNRGGFIYQKITIHNPFDKTQPVKLPMVELLDKTDPLVISYQLLSDDKNIRIGLVNNGLEPVTVNSARLLLPELIDQNGGKFEKEIPITLKPVNILALDSGELVFNLGVLEKSAQGSYKGFLVIKTDGNEAVIVRNIKLEVTAVEAHWPTFFNWAGTWVQGLFQGIPGFKMRFESAEWWVLLILLFVITSLIFKYGRGWWWRRGGKLAPVIIEDIEGRQDLTLTLRKCFANCGVMPVPSAPNAPTGFTGLTAVISESEVPQAQLIVTILQFLKKLWEEKPGYTVSCKLISEKDKTPVIIHEEIRLTDSGQVNRIRSFEADTEDEAAKKAAYYIFWYISGRKDPIKHLPEWSRFPTIESFQNYKQARECVNKEDYGNAVRYFKEATQESPYNVHLYTEWGSACELDNKYLDAFLIYLKAGLMWPDYYNFWYRIAIIMYSVDQWYPKQWEILDEDHRKILSNLTHQFIEAITQPERMGEFVGYWPHIKNFVINIFPKKNQTGSEKAGVSLEQNQKDFPLLTRALCLDYSCRISSTLEKILFRMFFIWLQRFLMNNVIYPLFNPARIKPNQSRYDWNLIPFIWNDGAQFLRMVRLMRCITQMIRGQYCPGENAGLNKGISNEKKSNEENFKEALEKTVEINGNHLWNRQGVYYNTACFYALYAKKDSNENDPKIRRALYYLEKADKDPRSVLDPKWVKRDPDLINLHNKSRFIAVYGDINDEIKKKNQKKDEDKETLYRTIKIIQNSAIKLIEYWKKESCLGIQSPRLGVEAAYHSDLWKSIIELCKNGTNADYQKLFLYHLMQINGIVVDMPPVIEIPDKFIDKINSCCRSILSYGQSQPETWSSRKKDSDFYLEHGGKEAVGVWESWGRGEVQKWSYILDLIEQVFPQ